MLKMELLILFIMEKFFSRLLELVAEEVEVVETPIMPPLPLLIERVGYQEQLP